MSDRVKFLSYNDTCVCGVQLSAATARAVHMPPGSVMFMMFGWTVDREPRPNFLVRSSDDPLVARLMMDRFSIAEHTAKWFAERFKDVFPLEVE